MRGGSGSRCVRSGTDTCLVGEQTALEAEDHAGAHKTAEDSLEVKCIREDHAQHVRNVADVQDDDDDGDQDIEHTHDRDQTLADRDDTSSAADQAVQAEETQSCAEDLREDCRIIEAVVLEGRLHVVSSQHVECDTVACDQADGEDDRQRTAVQSGLDVVCRSAVGASVRILLLIDLCKAGLHKTGSAAEKGDHPHPEQSAGAAKADGGGDADDVSGTDAGRGGDHQCAEGRNITLVLRLFQDHAPCLFEHSELHELRADREIDSADDQKRDQRPSPKETGNGIDD